MQQVEILHQDGKSTITVKGIKGPACLKATAQLEKDLGGVGGVASRKSTKEMQQRAQDTDVKASH